MPPWQPVKEKRVITDEGQILSVLAHQMAKQEGVELISPIDPPGAWDLWHKRARFAIRFLTEADWLRPFPSKEL